MSAVFPKATERVLDAIREEAEYGNPCSLPELVQTTGMLQHYVCEALILLLLAGYIELIDNRFWLSPMGPG